MPHGSVGILDLNRWKVPTFPREPIVLLCRAMFQINLEVWILVTFLSKVIELGAGMEFSRTEHMQGLLFDL